MNSSAQCSFVQPLWLHVCCRLHDGQLQPTSVLYFWQISGRDEPATFWGRGVVADVRWWEGRGAIGLLLPTAYSAIRSFVSTQALWSKKSTPASSLWKVIAKARNASYRVVSVIFMILDQNSSMALTIWGWSMQKKVLTMRM